jgi:hypothetical protein
MTSTDRLVAGVIGALLAPTTRLNEMKAALGVVIVCVAFATVMQVRMATTVASSMATHCEDFWIRIIRVFILLIPFRVSSRLLLPKIPQAWRDKSVFSKSRSRNWLRQVFSRSHDAVIRVYDSAGNVIETHEACWRVRRLM